MLCATVVLEPAVSDQSCQVIHVVAQIVLGRGQMPPFGNRLSDEQIAAVAQYIRNSWGNDFGPVTPKDVADTRQLLKRALQTQARLSQAQQ